MIEVYPLQWPAGWPRTQVPHASVFKPGSPHGEAVDIQRQRLELVVGEMRR